MPADKPTIQQPVKNPYHTTDGFIRENPPLDLVHKLKPRINKKPLVDTLMNAAKLPTFRIEL